MTLQAIIEHYGYVAIGIGTFAEGETILVLGGFAAHRGFLELPWVIVSAFIGSLAGDQLFFFLGRFRGQAILAKHPVWQIRAAHAQRLLDRYRIPVILGFRFMYGLRTVTPFVLGMGRVPTIEFVVLNVIAALVWAAAVATAGYLFGGALHALIGDLRRFEIAAMVAIAVIGFLLWLFHQHRSRKRAREVRRAKDERGVKQTSPGEQR